MPADAAQAWSPGPARPVLAERSLHVWLADLAAVTDDLAELLSPQESDRALRMAREQDRRLWARSRALLRVLLARYLGLDPRALEIVIDARGKPALAGSAAVEDRGAGPGDSAAGPSFNLSHSGPLALYAFARSDAVGVDVERRSRPLDVLALAGRALGSAEAARLAAVEPARRQSEFLRAWVRHEAALKCLGVGLSGARRDGAPAEPWVRELELDVPGAAAVAAQVQPVQLRCWRWHPALAAGLP